MTISKTFINKAKAYSSVTQTTHRVENLEANVQNFAPLTNTEVVQELTFQNQATQFTGLESKGEGRISISGTAAVVAEDTEATVVAYAKFDDVGGNGTASTSLFDSSLLRVPMLENEGRTAYYHGHAKYINWQISHPEVTHTSQMMLSTSVKLNVPGTVSNDQKGFVYYDSHANFNVSSNISVSLWFYPTTLDSIDTEVYRYLLYRYIDSSNYFIVTIHTLSGSADYKVRIFLNEAGTLTKIVSTNTVSANAWNLIMFTYNPTTNVLTLYLNNTSSTTTTASTLTPPYTANANMYIGGVPGLPLKRFTGYIDNLVIWSGKIVSSGEAANMWNNGTLTADSTKNLQRIQPSETVIVSEAINILVVPKRVRKTMATETVLIFEDLGVTVHQSSKHKIMTAENVPISENLAVTVTYVSGGNFNSSNFSSSNFMT